MENVASANVRAARPCARPPQYPSSRCPVSPASSQPHFDEAAVLYSRFAAPVKLHRGNSKLDFAWRSNGIAVGPVFLSSSAYAAGFTAQSEGPGDVFVLSIPLGSAGAKGSSGKQSTLATAGRVGFLSSPGAADHGASSR